MKTFGQLMQETRKSKGLTQDQVATILGVKRATYAQYESDKRTPKTLTLQKIAEALDCSIDSLIPDDLKSEALREEMLEFVGSPKNRADTIIDCLNETGVIKFLEYGDMLVSNDKYCKDRIVIAPADARFLTRFGGSPDAPITPDDKEPTEK